MQCPKCHEDVSPLPVGFTWWGGLIGSKIISHVECPRCHGRFNGKTGKSNDAAIAIYMIVVAVIAFTAMFAIMRH
ncbi:MAG: hypothetical protein H6Q90_2593 [Deltaproteobacteria bacterium]|nr:hypothetical protein [Deltaproteobacteria bacterium]